MARASSSPSHADEFALLTSTGTAPAPPPPSTAMEVDEASGQTAGAAAPHAEARAAVQQELLQRLMEDMVVHSRAEVRSTGV